MPRRARKVERAAAGLLLLATAPVSLAVAVGIWLTDGGPVFYLAERAGLDGATFRIRKFRTMRRGADAGARIAGPRDSRVFPFGAFLRRLRLDELPQLLNIVRGEMAFVGPRPEDPWIVDHAYTTADRETLAVLPGLTSPGTLYYVAHAEQFLSNTDAEAAYLVGPLRTKLELDRLYVARASASHDLSLIFETAWVLVCVACGRKYVSSEGNHTHVDTRQAPARMPSRHP
jgi:lipopolysaccharide/colanic/teichoic acid biosynthesis glycosyltransferase